ncbi:MAG: response regulator [Phototrophicaceae bacterium]
MPDTQHPKAKILVVDDLKPNLELLSKILKLRGYKVLEAYNGTEALQQVKEDQPDLVLLDINMPKMTGYEVCQRMKASPDTAHIPIIFISALNQMDNVIKGFDVGGADYITKPFNTREVIARVESQLTLLNQRRKIEELYHQQSQQFERLDEIRKRFIYNATHDMKNPIALILGYHSMLVDHIKSEQDEEAQTLLHGIEFGARQIESLIRQMLELAQLETRHNLPKTSQDMALIVKERYMGFRRLHSRLTLETPENPIMVSLNEERIERLVDNLISNALKYSADNTPVIVRLKLEPPYAVLQVIDRGYGIPAESLEEIFTAFYRVPRETPYPIEGSGLGLSIVKAIVEQHQGIITVESVVNEGSTFTVKLPL